MAMERLISALAVMCCGLIVANIKQSCAINTTPHWWELKPYIYMENRTAKGIFIDIIDKLNFYCHAEDHPKFSEGIYFQNNYSYFMAIVQSNYTQTLKTKQNQQFQIRFLPVLSPNVDLQDEELFYLRSFFSAKGAFLIIRRNIIAFSSKANVGFIRSIKVVFSGTLFAVCTGIIVWFWEKCHNPEFERRFPLGLLDAIWWATVTMTTVGYGDMVPRRNISRLITYFWIILGVIISAIITATVTDTLAGKDHTDIDRKEVAVIDNSWEKVIAQQYNAVPIGKPTYVEVLDAVRSGETYAALINKDVASWMQEEIRNGSVPLSIVAEIKENIPIRVVESRKFMENKNMSKCLDTFRQEILVETVKRYYKHTKLESIYFPDFKEYFLNSYAWITAAVALTLVISAGLEELVWTIYRRNKKPKNFVTKAHNNNDKEMGEGTVKETTENVEIQKLNRNMNEMKLMMVKMEENVSRLQLSYNDFYELKNFPKPH